MTDRTAIAMGGSGARGAEALVYLCAAGLGPKELTFVFADADTQNFNVTQALEVIGLYQKLQGSPISRDATPMFRTTLSTPKRPVWSPFGGTNNIDLERHFDYSAMSMSKDIGVQAGARLMETLYTKDQRQAKLNIGFRGKPSLGAAVCAETLDVTEEPWREIVNTLSINSGRKQQSWVFGMGSLFGGMGAASLPVIPARLKQGVSAGAEHVRLGALPLLPYFTFPPRPSDSKETVFASAELFALNSREALRYYSDQPGDFNDFYVLGATEHAAQPNFALGSKDQDNLPHYVEFAGALGALRFFDSINNENEGVHLLAIEHAGAFNWGDVPDSSRVQPALNNLARTCTFYLSAVFPVLEAIHRPQGANHSSVLRTPWYRDFIVKRGLEPSRTNNWERFLAMQLFAVRYLCWLRDIQRHCGNARLNLVDAHPLDGLSEAARTLSTGAFHGDLLKQGVSISLSSVWREFCHLCSRNPNPELEATRSLERALFAAASMGS